jgi:lipoprotein NlpI
MKHLFISIAIGSFISMTNYAFLQSEEPDSTQVENSLSIEAQEKFNAGVEAFQANNYSSAIEHYSAAIELAPEFAKAYLNRGFAYL